MSLLRSLYVLIKPGIVYGNSIALLAGFFYASIASAAINWHVLLAATAGTALVMASACVINNIFDRDIDAQMKRTQKRGLVTGDIPLWTAIVLSVILVTAGEYLLTTVSVVVALLGAVGWITYAFIYTYLKRKTYHATLFGTIPGAMPPLIGYVAAGGDSTVFLSAIFFLMVGWQMVHFYAISVYRFDDYTKASIPVVTRVLGIDTTLNHIKWWVLVAAISLGVLGLQSPVFGVLNLGLLSWWLYNTRPNDDIPPETWARNVFISSLFFLVLWLIQSIISAIVVLI